MPGRGMSFILYVVVLVVSVSSVMMGLDWLSTPPPPIPKSVQTVSAPAKPDAPAAARKTAATKSESKQTVGIASSPTAAHTDTAKSTPKTDTAKAAQQPAVAAMSETADSAPANATDGTTAAIATSGDVNGAAADAAVPRCDVQACAAHYRSFRESDCTYQPYDGPRRLCTVGNPPPQASDTAADMQTTDIRQQPASSSCNYQACSASYRSFDPATCTYQPYNGPRRLCEK